MKKQLLIFLLCLCGTISYLSGQTYPPACVVTMPYSNAYFKAGTDVEIHVYASDIGKTTNNGVVTKVEFFNGNTKLGESTSHTNYTYKFVWSCVPAGTYTIKAKATNDRAVAFTSVGVIITVGANNVTQRGMSACKGKYLANIIAGQPNINYNTYWNGVTAENSCKWGSVEGTQNVFNWGGADVSYNHAKNNNLIFRYHAAVWAAQYPSWLTNLSTANAKAEAVQYMTAIASRFPLTDQIDVLNEQLGNHQADNQKFRNLFGGGTNIAANDFRWQIWLFEQARALFPNTKLILNDYGLENDQNAITQQLELLKVLRDRGLVDGFGTQAHCFNIDGMSAAGLKSSLDRMTGAGVPIYVTELDLNGGQSSDNNAAAQLSSYQTHFPVYWDHPAVKGITLWGYVTGATWIGGTGLVSNTGVEKSAMTWLKSYVSGKPVVGYPSCATAACAGQPTVQFTAPANNATFTEGTTISLSATASDPGGSVSNVRFYNGTTLLATDNTAAYTFDWTNAPAGTHTLRAVATDNMGNTGEATITIKVTVPQGPYNGTVHPIPGTIQLESYDVGGNGVAYLDNTPGSAVTPVVNFRTTEDVDIENCTDAGGGYNLGWATAGEWLEYTVNVQTAGTYTLDLRVACQGDGRTLSVSMDGTNIASNVAIPNTAGWQTWQTISVNNISLSAGQKIMRITIGSTDYINLNYVTFALSQPPLANITTSGPTTFCSGGSAVLNAATGAGYTYQWKRDGNTIAGATASSYTTNQSGSYTVTVSANSQSATSAAVNIVVNPIPAAIITPSGPTTFVEGGSVVLNANTGSGLSYSWLRAATQVGTASFYTATSPGNYILEVTNASGCKATSSGVIVTVNGNQPSVISIVSPAANSTVTGPITISVTVSDPDGGITKVEYLDGTTVIGTSTTSPYSFTWSNPAAGDHVISVRVTDSNGGVTVSSPVTVTSNSVTGLHRVAGEMYGIVYPNPSKGEISIETNTDLSNAKVTAVNVLGEEIPLAFKTNGSGAIADVSILTEGAYILVVRKDNAILRKKITVIK